MDFEENIRKKLENAFQPEILEIRNDSALHAGHAGSPDTGNSHFSIRIKAKTLEGLSRVEQQRCVYAVLAEELQRNLHALQLYVLNNKNLTES
ncbi:MAG: BolA/IbaG family iron-sulfur metabolism protein [Alphaproteobacteria bacterium]|nr:BolA/IbaG family iron-sulfur metabolism protein [Alphaproteobacteria bacterium]